MRVFESWWHGWHFAQHRDRDGNLHVRYLYWDAGRWQWNANWLDNNWGGANPAALRATPFNSHPAFGGVEFWLADGSCFGYSGAVMVTAAKGGEVERLFKAGAHFAQVKSRRHPSMKPFILGMKSRTEIIDLAKTESQLMAAKEALAALARDGKTVLFVGGKPEIATLVKAAANKIGAPYVATRWLGGTLSNFVEIKKRIDRLADLTEKQEAGTLAKQHTKLEVLKLGREAKKLTLRLDGIATLAKRPDAMLVVDTKHEKHAVKEAKQMGVPVIAIMNSDCDLKDAAYPIIANDASREVVKMLLADLVEAFEKGRAA